jgi:hypothetical protein
MIAAALVILLVLVSLVFIGNPGKTKKRDGQDAGEVDSPPAIGYQEKLPDGFLEKKLQIEQVEDPGDPDEKKERPKSEVKPFTEDPNWMEDVIDRDENLEPEAFYYLIHRVATLPAAELDKIIDPKLDSEDFLRSPSALRGRAVRIRGTLIGLREKDFEENRSGIRTGYIGTMVDNHWEPLSFYILELPEGIKSRDVIEVRGYFYKIWKYRNQENRILESPLIIGKTAKKIAKYPKKKPIKIFGIDLVIGSRNIGYEELFVGLLVIILIPVMFFLVRAERRKYALFKQAQAEKRKGGTRLPKGKPAATDGTDAPPAPGTAPPAQAPPATPDGEAPAPLETPESTETPKEEGGPPPDETPPPSYT